MLIPYGNGSVVVNSAAKTHFTPGSGDNGYLEKCVLAYAQSIFYGPSRSVQIRGSGTFTTFEDGYVSGGVHDISAFLQKSSGPVFVPASSIMTFTNGYLLDFN